MPPRRDARSPPRVQPQNDQAEEIRLIRERLDTLEQKHGDLQKKHDGMVAVFRVFGICGFILGLGALESEYIWGFPFPLLSFSSSFIALACSRDASFF